MSTEGGAAQGWSPEEIADAIELLDVTLPWLLYQLDLIQGQRAQLSTAVIRRLDLIVQECAPAEEAKAKLAALPATELFAGLRALAGRQHPGRGQRPPLRVHEGGQE